MATSKNVFGLAWFILDDDRCYLTLNFGTSLFDLYLDSRSQWSEKVKTSMPVISQSYYLMWMEFGMLLRLAGLMDLTFFSSNIGWHSHIYILVSFKLDMVIDTAELTPV